MARRLKAIAKDINENMDGYTAEISEGYCNTDRKIGRLRSPGKGRYGNKITIYKNGAEVFEHNSAETYRYNEEVEEWLNEIKGI
jgi:hypothetical protein